MDEEVLTLARRLQARLEGVDPLNDRDTLVWAHGLLTGIQSRIPELSNRAMDRKTVSDSQEELKQILKELKARTGLEDDDMDSLDEIERELGGPDDARYPQGENPSTAVPLDRDLPI